MPKGIVFVKNLSFLGRNFHNSFHKIILARIPDDTHNTNHQPRKTTVESSYFSMAHARQTVARYLTPHSSLLHHEFTTKRQNHKSIITSCQICTPKSAKTSQHLTDPTPRAQIQAQTTRSSPPLPDQSKPPPQGGQQHARVRVRVWEWE